LEETLPLDQLFVRYRS